VGDLKLGVDMPKLDIDMPKLEVPNIVPKDLLEEGVEWGVSQTKDGL